MSNFNIYDHVTNLVIQKLQEDVIPWRTPWSVQGGMPRNLATKRPYRGINTWLLLSDSFTSPFYLTFKQIKVLGGTLKKGEKSTIIVFWKLIEVFNADTLETEKKPLLRYYRVFNLQQTEGIDSKLIPECKTSELEFESIEACASVVRNWLDCPTIDHRQNKAFYVPGKDFIGMPDPRHFVSNEEYYSTLFHEMIHATGHPKRLDRFSKQKDHRFGSKDYSQEELVAEMGASFLCGVGNILPSTLDNSAAYIEGWMKKFKDDNRILIFAASQAQKAAEYILGNFNVTDLKETEESNVQIE